MRFVNFEGRPGIVRYDNIHFGDDFDGNFASNLNGSGRVNGDLQADARKLIQYFKHLQSTSLDDTKIGYGRRMASGRLGPPIKCPSKILAAPANYRRHIEEMDTQEMRPLGKVEKVHDIERYGLFLKAPSSIIGPAETIELPFTDRRIDHEIELAVVIGAEARDVKAADAMSYVFGYTIALDITVRGGEERSTRKSFDTFSPIGPVLVTADEIPNPHNLDLKLWVNNKLRQNANTADLIWDIPKLIEYASHIMTLIPGDIIITGTPEGVGPIQPGDVIAAEIEQIGRFSIGVGLRVKAPV